MNHRLIDNHNDLKASDYGCRWLLFSSGNHSICSANDCFTGQLFSIHGNWTGFSFTPLWPGDVLVCGWAWCVVCPKTLAICHFGDFGSCSCVSNLIQGFFRAKNEQRCQ